MDVAERFAQLSTARRLQVGAIVTKDDRVISIGYNGTPAGWDNNCEFEFVHPQTKISELVTKKEVIHAESNAIGKLARSSESGDGATMYITHAPCFDCAKLIHVAGINKVFYHVPYRSTDGIDFLKKCKIEVEQI
jgi:dCMP deaminase